MDPQAGAQQPAPGQPPAGAPANNGAQQPQQPAAPNNNNNAAAQPHPGAQPNNNQPGTYQQRFSNIALDVYNGNYAPLTQQYATGAGAPTHQDLWDITMANCNNPCNVAYLILARTALGPSVGCLLNPSVYRDPVGMPPTEYNGCRVCQLGDVAVDATMGGVQPRFVVFPDRESAFVPELAVIVPTLPQFLPLLDALGPDEHHIAPLDANNAGTEAVTVRRIQPVGPRLLQHFIARRWWPVKEFARLALNLLGDQALAAAHPQLSGWIRGVCTGSLAGANNASQLLFPALPSIVPDGACLRIRMDWIRRDCPAAFQPTGAPQGNADLVAVLREEHAASRAENRAAREAARAKSDNAKSVEEVFAAALDAILAMCGVAEVSELPSFWPSMAAAPAKQRLKVAQGLLDSLCRLDPYLVNAQPVLTITLLDRILSGTLASRDTDDLTSGLNHYHFTYRNPSDREDSRRLIEQYTFLHSGETVGLAEAETLRALSEKKVKFPTTYNHVSLASRSLIAVCSLFLGAGHEFVLRLEAGHGELIRNMVQITRHFEENPLWPVLACRSMQHTMTLYWRSKAAGFGVVSLPEFSALWLKISIGQTDWITSMPPQFTFTGLVPPPLPPCVPGAGPPAPQASGSGGGGGGGSAGGTPGGSPPGGGDAAREQVMNPSVVPAIRDALGPPGAFKMKEVKESLDASWPVNDSGVKMCLSYHGKGRCFSNCGRSGDHRAHSAAETERLQAFLTANSSTFLGN